MGDPSVVKGHTERRQTAFDQQGEIKTAYGLRDFAEVEAEFTAWVDARAWNTGDGARHIFTWIGCPPSRACSLPRRVGPASSPILRSRWRPA
ncbi:hypothetical protein AB0K01_29245 [Microbispora rosea]